MVAACPTTDRGRLTRQPRHRLAPDGQRSRRWRRNLCHPRTSLVSLMAGSKNFGTLLFKVAVQSMRAEWLLASFDRRISPLSC